MKDSAKKDKEKWIEKQCKEMQESFELGLMKKLKKVRPGLIL